MKLPAALGHTASLHSYTRVSSILLDDNLLSLGQLTLMLTWYPKGVRPQWVAAPG